MLAMRA
jgi:hypothetical protein